jgi:hypothetical protein
MTIRHQDIMTSFDTRMKTILVANGYHTGIGGNVLGNRGRQIDGGYIPIDASELPCLLYRDVLHETTTKNLDGDKFHRLTVEVEVRCEEGANTDSFLRQARADIIKALGVDTTWGGNAIRTDVETDEKASSHVDKVVGATLARAVILYATALWQES